MLDWTQPLRHPSFYKAVFRPAALRANRTAGNVVLPAGLRFHSLRHTYASLCASVPSISVRQVAEWMGHANPTTTELDLHAPVREGRPRRRDGRAGCADSAHRAKCSEPQGVRIGETLTIEICETPFWFSMILNAGVSLMVSELA